MCSYYCLLFSIQSERNEISTKQKGSAKQNLLCGERGIRTLVTVARKTVFETVPFNHSGISPIILNYKKTRTAAGNLCGGELGIRTPGPVTVNSFQDCRNRPLCQLSGCKIIVCFCICQKLISRCPKLLPNRC